jgi:hypothetical protein
VRLCPAGSGGAAKDRGEDLGCRGEVANAAAAAWCAEVSAAVHSEISAVPEKPPDAERDLLAPLPSLRPEIGAVSVTRKVDRLSCNRYGSAPWTSGHDDHRCALQLNRRSRHLSEGEYRAASDHSTDILQDLSVAPLSDDGCHRTEVKTLLLLAALH